MISSETFNNLKYFSKIAFIFIIIFLLLKFIIDLPSYEAILLACIIAVSILIIENIIYINNKASDPLNCDGCKIQKDDIGNLPISQESIENFQGFGGDILNKIKENSNIIANNLSSTVNNIILDSAPTYVEKVDEIKNDKYDIINSDPNLINSVASENQMNDNNINTLKAIMNNASPNLAMDPNAKPNPTASMVAGVPLDRNAYAQGNIEGFEVLDSFIEEEDNEQENKKMLPKIDLKQKLSNEKESVKMSESKGIPLSDYIDTPSDGIYTGKPSPKIKLPDGTSDPIAPIESTFDEGYVKYQQDGLQALDNKIALKNNIFRASIGNQEVVQNYLKDGEKYYNDIFTRSTNAPKTYESLNSELKYGDYNYLSPINKGMTNRAYTFINPTNWYPIPPFPPVCVTNRSCTTCPIQMNDGRDYMSYAPLEDFDNARRFTGDMGINVDYIKNVLNNPDAY